MNDDNLMIVESFLEVSRDYMMLPEEKLNQEVLICKCNENLCSDAADACFN